MDDDLEVFPPVPQDPQVTLSDDQVTELVEAVRDVVLEVLPDQEIVAEAGGEILVPDEGELIVIQELVRGLLSYFQEDDSSRLSDIRDTSGEILDVVEEIRQDITFHPLMETPFSDYSVSEGLLLFLVLYLLIIRPCIRMVQGGFSWLLS